VLLNHGVFTFFLITGCLCLPMFAAYHHFCVRYKRDDDDRPAGLCGDG